MNSLLHIFPKLPNSMKPACIFRQLFDQKTSTYSYLIGDPVSKKAVIIDPVKEQVDRDMELIKELGLELEYVFDTHIHADHVTGSGQLRKLTGAKIVMGEGAKIANPDILLKDGETVYVGTVEIQGLSTPGHTSGCMTFQIADMLFTGDALLIRKTGRTDFQEGSSAHLYDSIMKKLYVLPDETRIFPGHDYTGRTMSTVGEEKLHNTRILATTSREEFESTMRSLKLEYPKYIDVALPANRRLGMEDEH